VLALLLASVVNFSLDSARFDLVVVTAGLAIFLSGGLRSRWMWGAHCGVLWLQPSSTSQGGQAHRAPRQTRVIGRRSD